MEKKCILTSLLQKINIMDCALSLISVRIGVTVQVATNSNFQSSIVCVFVAE